MIRAEHLHQETPPVVTVPGNAINRVCRVGGTKFSTVSWQGRTHLPKPETLPTGSATFACLEDSWSSPAAKKTYSYVHMIWQLQNKIRRHHGSGPLCLQKESPMAWTRDSSAFISADQRRSYRTRLASARLTACPAGRDCSI